MALAGALATAVPPARAEPFRVVSYNVHGISWMLSRLKIPLGPHARMRAIATELQAFDLAVLQEDFAFHGPLTERFPDTHVARGGGPVFRCGYVATAPLWLPFLALLNVGVWPIFNGDGLTIVAPNRALRVERLASERYARCGDYLFAGSDCFAAKGLLAVRVTLPNGAAVDVYDTHLEAGSDRAGDARQAEVRRSQLVHLADAIRRHSEGRAVVVAGDFNADAARPESFAPVHELMTSAGLADSRAWTDVDLERWRRTVDHILYRDGCGVRLGVPAAGEASGFRTAAGRALSDHPAVTAAFEVEPATPPPGVRCP